LYSSGRTACVWQDESKKRDPLIEFPTSDDTGSSVLQFVNGEPAIVGPRLMHVVSSHRGWPSGIAGEVDCNRVSLQVPVGEQRRKAYKSDICAEQFDKPDCATFN
jgi:hypothetical protein